MEAIDERGLRKKEFLQNYAVWKAREPNKSHSSGCKVTTSRNIHAVLAAKLPNLVPFDTEP